MLHIGQYSARMAKISILKSEGMNKEISYERRVYELVDNNSLSYALYQKTTKKELVEQGLNYSYI